MAQSKQLEDKDYISFMLENLATWTKHTVFRKYLISLLLLHITHKPGIKQSHMPLNVVLFLIFYATVISEYLFPSFPLFAQQE